MINVILSQQIVLSPEQQKDLVIAIKNCNNKETRKELVSKLLASCYKLVFRIMKSLAIDKENYNTGIEGFLTGIDNYNPSLNVPFVSYIAQHIRASFLSEIKSSNNGYKYNSIEMRKLYYNYDKTVSKLLSNGIEATEANIATELSVSIEHVKEYSLLRKSTLSLDYTNESEDGETTMYDKVSAKTFNPEQIYLKRERKQLLSTLPLTKQEKEYIVYALDETNSYNDVEISHRLKVSPQRISFIRNSIIEKGQKRLQ